MTNAIRRLLSGAALRTLGRSLILVAIFAGVVTLGSVAPVSATGGATPKGTFTVQLVRPSSGTASQASYFTLTLRAGGAPGAKAVLIGNPTALPITLYVDGVAGLTGQTSGAVYANRVDRPRGAASWVAPTVHELTVEPHQVERVSFIIKVPAGTLAGDHLAGLAVENAEPNVSGTTVRIREIVRTVVGVLVRVPGSARFHARLLSVGLATVSGSRVADLAIGMTDDGGALGRPVLGVHLVGPHGYTRSMSRALDTLLPSDVIDYPCPWPDDLVPGTYTATVSLALQGTPTARMVGTFAVDRALQAVSRPKSGHESRRSSPVAASVSSSYWLLLGAALAGLAGGALLRRLRGAVGAEGPGSP